MSSFYVRFQQTFRHISNLAQLRDPYVLCICILTEHENQISKVSGYDSVLK
jgi:hypothetical protein